MGHCNGDIESQQAPKEKSVLCLAVVRDESSDVVVFDVKGEPKIYSYQDIANKNGNTNNSNGTKICFSTHGHDADDLLTPCFDEEGCHGEPEESCFCGIEEPHLHAHWHDPKICDADEASLADVKADEALMKLAKLTLEPLEEEASTAPLMLSLPVSDHMPNECNANELFTSLSDGGHGVAALRYRRRMHKVQVSKTTFYGTPNIGHFHS